MARKILEKEVEELAKLARLGLTDREKGLLSLELSEILNYVEMLQEVDTVGVPETSQVTGSKNISRRDQKKDSRTTVKSRLSNVPHKEGDHIKVQKVLE